MLEILVPALVTALVFLAVMLAGREIFRVTRALPRHVDRPDPIVAEGWQSANTTVIDSTQTTFKIHSLCKGEGEIVLLLHGIGASNYCWRFVMGVLSRDFQVCAVDLPGFGASDKNAEASYSLELQAERLVRFLDQQGYKKVHLVGSSMGGTIALAVATWFPDRVDQLVLIAPATNPRLVPQYIQALAKRSFYIRRILAQTASRVLRAPMGSYIFRRVLQRVKADRHLIHSETMQRYLEPFQSDGLTALTFLAATEALSDPRLPVLFKVVRQPTLILWGYNDMMVGHRFMEELRRVLPEAEFQAHEWAGHHVMEDDPLWVIDKIRNNLLRRLH